MDPIKARHLFPVTQQYAYLNHASAAALPRPVTDAVEGYVQRRSLGGSEALLQLDADLDRIRGTAARFVGAQPDEITFTGSVSHGLNIVAAGLPWQEGDNMICAETEFPANVYPWVNLRRRGVEVRFAPARNYRIQPQEIKALIDERTRLVAVSFVEFGTGYRNNLQDLSALCHARGVYLCVDGIQGLGALQFQVDQTPVDFLATQAAKWMLGPIGAGFLYVRGNLRQHLDPVMSGWRSVVDRDDYYSYDSPLRDSGERFEPGSANVLGLIGLEAAIQLLLAISLETVEARIHSLTDYLIEGLKSQGCQLCSPLASWQERSGIVCFSHPRVQPVELARRLHEASVLVSLRGAVIRVSPHFYNNQQDLDQLLDVVRTIA